MDTVKELKEIFSTERLVKTTDRNVVIRQIRVGDLHTVTKFVQLHLAGASDDTTERIMKVFQTPEGKEQVIDLIQATTDLTRQEIENMNMYGLLAIINEVVEENLPFLEKEVLPILARLLGNILGTTKSKS